MNKREPKKNKVEEKEQFCFDILSLRCLKHIQMVVGSRLVKIRPRAQENEVRAGPQGADVITQGKRTVKGLRRILANQQHFRE